MNYLWGGMILVGVVYAAMTGNLGAVTDQALASAKEAVSLCLTMTGAMAFWVGLMKIAEKGGMVNRAASAMGPILPISSLLTDTTFFVSVSSGKFRSRQIYGNEYGVQFSGAGLGGNPGRDFCHERVKAAAENVKSGDRRDV